MYCIIKTARKQATNQTIANTILPFCSILPNKLGSKELTAFLNTVLGRLGADQLLTPREVTRDFLGLLNILYQNPDTTFDSLINEQGFAVKSAEKDPEQIDEETDDLFAEFDI